MDIKMDTTTQQSNFQKLRKFCKRFDLELTVQHWRLSKPISLSPLYIHDTSYRKGIHQECYTYDGFADLFSCKNPVNKITVYNSKTNDHDVHEIDLNDFSKKWGVFISPTGGFCLITVQDISKKVVFSGKYNFPKNKNHSKNNLSLYCRRTGIDNAIARLTCTSTFSLWCVGEKLFK